MCCTSKRALGFTQLLSVPWISPGLKKARPKYVCFVSRPETAGRDLVVGAAQLLRKIDSDAYGDAFWGILTGYEAADAMRIVKAPRERVIRRAATSMGSEGAVKEWSAGFASNEGNKNDFCGFVHRNNYLPGEDDAYVPGQMIKRMGLRRGDYIKGFAIPKRGKDRYAPLKRITEVNGIPVIENDYENIRRRPKFESLTAIYPDERLDLETEKEDISTRIIDLFSPIGKGQRGMIVSPPKAGKTILLQKVANSITANNPDCELIVLLIDERPEEVTDMQRNIQGEVVYSTFDKRPENHVRVTELVLERAMRLVELGKDVVILLDSMTRLARAYNLKDLQELTTLLSTLQEEPCQAVSIRDRFTDLRDSSVPLVISSTADP